MKADPSAESQRTPFVRFLYSQPLWRRRLIVLVVLAALFSLPTLYGWRVITAERVTIHVTDCPDKPPARNEGCGGTWTLPDGTPGHGVIDGYAPSGGDGVTVAGWATAGRATTTMSIWLLYPIAGLIVFVGAVFGIVVLWLRQRGRQRGSGRG